MGQPGSGRRGQRARLQSFGGFRCDSTNRIQRSRGSVAVWTSRTAKSRTALQYNTQWQISQGWTCLRGKHEFKIGGAWRKFTTLGQDLANTNGRYTFNRAQTGLLGQTNTGHEFASFLLGGVGSRVQCRSARTFRYDCLLRHVRILQGQLAYHEQADAQSRYSIRGADRLAHPWRERLLARRHQRSEPSRRRAAGRLGVLRDGSGPNGREPVLSD